MVMKRERESRGKDERRRETWEEMEKRGQEE